MNLPKFFYSVVFGLLCCLNVQCSNDQRSDNQDYEDYGDFYRANLSLNTTVANHPHGWKRQNCFLCHNHQNIHRIDRIADLNVNLDEIQQKTTKGLSSCAECHGDNGVDLNDSNLE